MKIAGKIKRLCSGDGDFLLWFSILVIYLFSYSQISYCFGEISAPSKLRIGDGNTYTEIFYVTAKGDGTNAKNVACIKAGTCWDMADFNANQDTDDSADNKAGANDIVYFSEEDGDFTTSMVICGAGTSDSTRLTLTRYGNEKPTIDISGGKYSIDADGSSCVTRQRDYVTISYLKLLDSSARSLHVKKMDYLIVENMDVRSNQMTDSGDYLYSFNDISHLTFRDNYGENYTSNTTVADDQDIVLLYNITGSKGANAFEGYGVYRNRIYGTTHTGINISQFFSSDVSVHGNYISLKYDSDQNGTYDGWRGYGRAISSHATGTWIFWNFFDYHRTRSQFSANNVYVYTNLWLHGSECCEDGAIDGGDTDCIEEYDDYASSDRCDANATSQMWSFAVDKLQTVDVTGYFYNNTGVESAIGTWQILIESGATKNLTAYVRNNAFFNSTMLVEDSKRNDVDYPAVVNNWVTSDEWTITAENNIYYPYTSAHRPPNDAVRYDPDNDVSAAYYQIPTDGSNSEWNTADDNWKNLTTDKERIVDWRPDKNGEPEAGSENIDYGKTGLSITNDPDYGGNNSFDYGIKVNCLNYDDFVGTIEGCLILRDSHPDVGAFEFVR